MTDTLHPDDPKVLAAFELLHEALHDGADYALDSHAKRVELAERLVRAMELADVAAPASSEYVIDYDDAKHKYWIDGVEVPSVTTILDATFSKAALPWWGMRVGAAAVVQLLATDGWAQLANANTPAEIIRGAPDPGKEFYGQRDTKKAKPKTYVEARLVDEKLSTNHIKEDAGDRGTSIHDALELLGVGEMPKIEDYPEANRGWIAGLVDWWLETEPEFIAQEIIVGSKRHGFAGRFDVICKFHAGPFADRGPMFLDLKTSKGVYESHLVQMAGYEIGYYEMGLEQKYGKLDGHVVLHLPRTLGGRGDEAEGSYRMFPSRCRPSAFLAHVAVFREDEQVRADHPELHGNTKGKKR